jgi:hypothetical protein
MLTYHHVVFVLEYLRAAGVSQHTSDRVLALLWKEANRQVAEQRAGRKTEAKPELLA